MPATPTLDFIALQVRDLEAAADFYEHRLGLVRAPSSPPGAVVFATGPIPFAVRELMPDVDLDSGRPGLGVALWMGIEGARALHDRLQDAGVRILTPPFQGPFGDTFVLEDLDGYVVTLHEAA